MTSVGCSLCGIFFLKKKIFRGLRPPSSGQRWTRGQKPQRISSDEPRSSCSKTMKNRAEVEMLAEVEELLQHLRVHVPEVPQIPRSVTDLGTIVAVAVGARSFGGSKNQRSRGSSQFVPLSRAVQEDTQQDLACWMVSTQLEWRDALEMGDIKVSQLISKGASGQSVALLWFPTWFVEASFPGGVRVGGVSNLGFVQTRSTRRLAELQDTSQDNVRVDVASASVALVLGPVQTQVGRSCPVSQVHASSDGHGFFHPWQACGPTKQIERQDQGASSQPGVKQWEPSWLKTSIASAWSGFLPFLLYVMPRGWSKAPVMDGWVQIIRGPRP